MLHVPHNPDEFRCLAVIMRCIGRIVVVWFVIAIAFIFWIFYPSASKRTSKAPPTPRTIVHVRGGVVDINCGEKP